jgi:S1-C subfamily serine protease
MMMKRRLLMASVLGAGVVAGLVLSGRMSLTQTALSREPVGTTSPAQVASRVPLDAAVLPDLSSIAERALKAAANISSTSVQVVQDPLTRFLYGRDMVQPSQSLGSGVVVSEDGYVLTNTHVIGSARAEIKVTLSDNREHPARLVGFDDLTDLAVIKIDGKDLETLPWGDSSKLRVAEWVLAIGNPFNLSGTVTLGIVSSTNRSGSQVGAFSDLIQTDAAINQGNSGGALVNARGELVGINSMIYTESGGNVGLGFAIPSNVARDIMQQLVQHGEVRYGSVGNSVSYRVIDRDTARYNGLGDVGGVLVWQMARTDSAYRAGLRPYDIVVAVNGREVKEPDEITRLIYSLPVGGTARFDVVRRGQRQSLNVPVVAR